MDEKIVNKTCFGRREPDSPNYRRRNQIHSNHSGTNNIQCLYAIDDGHVNHV